MKVLLNIQKRKQNRRTKKAVSRVNTYIKMHKINQSKMQFVLVFIIVFKRFIC